jgi:hypothetical protein
MKIHEIKQRSIEWMILHIGRITASEFGNLVTPLMKQKEGEGPKTYLCKKLAEVYRGEPMCNLSPKLAQSAQMEQGLFLEEHVIPWFEFTYDIPIRTVGFCETDDGLSGCSPDGLIGEDGGIEVKSPEPHTHCQNLLAGEVPREYMPQIHFSMFVTGRQWWKFISYRKNFPALIVTIERDEAIMARIAGIVSEFHSNLSHSVAKLRSLK